MNIIRRRTETKRAEASDRSHFISGVSSFVTRSESSSRDFPLALSRQCVVAARALLSRASARQPIKMNSTAESAEPRGMEGFSIILFTVSARVVLGHSGHAHLFQKRLRFLIASLALLRALSETGRSRSRSEKFSCRLISRQRRENHCPMHYAYRKSQIVKSHCCMFLSRKRR